MFLLRAVLNIFVRNASPRGPMCFRCLIFSLSGPCELLFLLCFCLLDLSVASVMLYPCMFCVALSVDLFVLCVACLTVFVNCLVKQFAISLGVFVILLLNVVELLSVVGGARLERPCMVFHKICVCCFCGPSERLDAPSISWLVFCMSEVITSFKSLRAGSQVFALLILFLCVSLHTMSSGRSLQLQCIFPFGMLYLSAITMMFVKILLAVCKLVGMVSERKRTLCLL